MIAHATSIQRTRQPCCWVLATMRRCGAPVRFTMVLDDDSNRVRNYDPFCPRHRAQANARVAAGDDE